LSYLNRVLQPGETVLVRTRLHGVIFLRPIFLLVVAAGVAIAGYVLRANAQLALALYALGGLIGLVGVVDLIGKMILRGTTEFGVTSHRVVVKRGIFSLHTVEMNLDKVESVDVDQSLMGRMLGYGAVVIHGVGSRWDPIVGIGDPFAFRSAITTHRAPATEAAANT
jgi:uncharacterized membrane protein YdbT with pleckstrin-like domain